MPMYNPKIESKYFNISIDGLDLIGFDFQPAESFNRRETARHNIIGGTQSVIRTTYVPRDFTFKCKLQIDPLYPDIYDSTFQLWMSKSVEVISRELGGGKFNAECVVKKTHETPAYLTLEIHLTEIPENSLIPNDGLNVPTVKVVKTNQKDTKKTNKDKDKGKNSKKNRSKNGKDSKKNRRKTRKGGKITLTKNK